MATARMQKTIDTIKNERRRFETFCRSLSDEELARPVPDSTWIVRDFIPHLGTLDTELIRWFEGVANGVPDAIERDADGRPFQLDNWNDSTVAERREWTLDKIFDEAAANRERLIVTLEKLTDEQTDSVTKMAGDSKRPPAEVPLKLFLAGWAHHDAVHVADMLKALPERADEPEMRAWMDHPAVTWYQKTMAGPTRN
ncbi:MAG: maleylpyruvate isomerase N-terminal domain-containing protein [Chloroflexi bacterium]|nr:maleylpyruvate isomerase N-terminal domain-containing protein [Chloroflexota bacterium]MCI0783068.1 maleylpyruvate isomerase N-terminal domain-containing protein [Chloroflexota bacterium]MCI0816810.1 maleylpyruvate isomerase N-terminal domain-containing protein [Chloroflexota bacterium]MCI0819008.1 maleylpyruvate isomerase N-terminal domain-containing protein [Chloroflexota bacterium]MCI0831787.1 maleylpyruvate isomerase N-terminal domain-containing protein [Chloroflexota bacterium]